MAKYCSALATNRSGSWGRGQLDMGGVESALRPALRAKLVTLHTVGNDGCTTIWVSMNVAPHGDKQRFVTANPAG
jgi:hypothetical protein